MTEATAKPQPDGTTPTDVLVVGGGLAGLAAAAYLARAGRAVALYERNETLGGRARTETREDYQLNLGPHALYTDGAAAAVFADLGVQYTAGDPPGPYWLSAGAQRWAMPMGPMGLLRHGRFSLRDKFAAMRFFGQLQRIDLEATAELTVDDWLSEQRVPERVATLLRSLVRLTTYCAESGTLSAGAAIGQLRQAFGGGVVYPDDGWQSLVNGIAERARSAGASLNTSQGVRALASVPSGVEATLSDGTEVRARAAVLALPPGPTLGLLGDTAPEALRRFVDGARPVRAACLDVGLSHLPRPNVPFALDLEEPLYMSLHSANARLAPAGGHLLQLARYGGDPDGRARARLESWLEPHQPGWREHAVVERYVPAAKVMSALPSAAQGGLPGRPSTNAAGPPHIQLCGDWIGPEGMLSDASLASAREAARQLTTEDASAAA